MEIRNTLPEDMDRVMFIFEQARQFMRLNGNLHQWTGGYPSEEVLEADISSNSSFVCVDDQKEVVGTFCFRYGFSSEPTYNVIYDGGWLNEGKASSGKAESYRHIQVLKAPTGILWMPSAPFSL